MERKKINMILEAINKNRTAIIVIALVFVCTIIGVSYIIDIMFKAHLLQSPCDLCESFQAAKNIPINIEELNRQLNITEELGDCVGAVQQGINESHFRKTCESLSLLN